MTNDDCFGQHRFFVADVAQVETEGKIVLIAMCTNCGELKVSEVKVTGEAKLLKGK